ncbi:MAG TPA: 6-phospho-beta-glucosidase [Erysipelotrichaceae bacterium]|nr:6-phospho-beta-glucosidase [Erysipelotrichaceae bacterium]OGS58584.1 MAG: 6-phospho-beta-glucosidase [Firmicutes bacterium GWE2_51_13]HAO61316.1 6-phospho-beta-glucosidase [Erysipelotrichaceae bacterium]HBZ41873.1 6-phospho-beta-glucosidase [Erysipelotrichaceae bacterium]
MKQIKIVTIGGGSSYTPELIEGFINRQAQLNIKEIWLVDIEEGREKLEIVGAMAKRMVEAAGLPWEVHLTLDRREALKDADFVTTQFRVGLLDARIRDERIPLSHGLIGQETNGAGGIFKAFRTIPVILAIIKDMKELCPNAWLVNFTNPSGMVTEAAIKVGGWKKTIGLCNVPIGLVKMANAVMGVAEDSEELFTKFAGLNHFHWHRVWDKDGNEVTAHIIDEVYKPENKGKYAGVKNVRDLAFNFEQVRDTGLLPCSYHRYYYITNDMLKSEMAEYAEGKTRAEVVKRTEAELFELYKDPALNYKPEQLTKRGGTHYSDAACEVVASIVNDKRTQMVVSTQNNGAISDLPYDCVVEVSALITSHGAEALNWGSFPPATRGILQVQKAMEEVVIDAAVTGDYGKALQAFTVNPLIPSGAIARDLLNEMLVANKNYLPQFSAKIAELEAAGVTYVAK